MPGPDLSPEQGAALVRELERRRNGHRGNPSALRRLDLAQMAATPRHPSRGSLRGSSPAGC